MSKNYECKFCGRGFEFASDKNDHEATCGISKLSDYGIDTGSLEEIRDAKLERGGASSRQLQLNEMVVKTCPVCGTEIREQDKYMDFENFLECRNCEKVVDVRGN